MRKATLRKIKLKKYTERYKNFTGCTSCRENCSENNISCLLCRKLFHPKCLRLSKKLSEKMKKTDSFICTLCLCSKLPFFDSDNIDFLFD